MCFWRWKLKPEPVSPRVTEEQKEQKEEENSKNSQT